MSFFRLAERIIRVVFDSTFVEDEPSLDVAPPGDYPEFVCPVEISSQIPVMVAVDDEDAAADDDVTIEDSQSPSKMRKRFAESWVRDEWVCPPAPYLRTPLSGGDAPTPEQENEKLHACNKILAESYAEGSQERTILGSLLGTFSTFTVETCFYYLQAHCVVVACLRTMLAACQFSSAAASRMDFLNTFDREGTVFIYFLHAEGVKLVPKRTLERMDAQYAASVPSSEHRVDPGEDLKRGVDAYGKGLIFGFRQGMEQDPDVKAMLEAWTATVPNGSVRYEFRVFALIVAGALMTVDHPMTRLLFQKANIHIKENFSNSDYAWFQIHRICIVLFILILIMIASGRPFAMIPAHGQHRGMGVNAFIAVVRKGLQKMIDSRTLEFIVKADGEDQLRVSGVLEEWGKPRERSVASVGIKFSPRRACNRDFQQANELPETFNITMRKGTNGKWTFYSQNRDLMASLNAKYPKVVENQLKSRMAIESFGASASALDMSEM